MPNVRISKVQAIGHIEFNMPEGSGGVRLLRGENGAGKTTALLCLNALLGRKVSLVPSDDAPKGIIEGLGRQITIQKRSTSRGDVDVPTLEGRFDFSDLVEPPIKDPVARNKARIRSLVGLTAGEGSLSHFYEVFGGQAEFESLMKGRALPDSGDVLDLADSVKAAAQEIARAEEARLESETAKWQVAVADSKGVKPTEQPPSVAELANRYSEAQRARLEATEKINASSRAKQHNAFLRSKLEAHQTAKPAQDMEQALEVLNKCKAAVAEIEAKLAQAKANVDEAKRRFDAAHQWEQRLVELEDAMLEESEESVDIEPLQVAEESALEQLKNAEEMKRCFDAAVQAKQLGESIKARKERAEKLRALSQKTYEVVTSKLPSGCPLQVKDGMLSAFHKERGAWVPFDELSEGERWKASLQIAIDAVGEGGILPTRQESWQSLDTEARKWVAAECKKHKVWLISGEVADGPLRVEELN